MRAEELFDLDNLGKPGVRVCDLEIARDLIYRFTTDSIGYGEYHRLLSMVVDDPAVREYARHYQVKARACITCRAPYMRAPKGCGAYICGNKVRLNAYIWTMEGWHRFGVNIPTELPVTGEKL